ncbi:response regulator [bacterium]|nr:response regulator [bacterium]
MGEDLKRILIVDDNDAIHEDIHNILDAKTKKKDSETEHLEDELFGIDESSTEENEIPLGNYRIDDAYQGTEAITMVEKAAQEGFPYALIFMDVRMPPGIDGIQTITEIWKKYSQIEMVICTAYSDYSWDQIVKKIGSTDNLLFMKKPFDSITLKQMALSLTKKWDLAKKNREYIESLEEEVSQRTEQLNQMAGYLNKLKEDAEELTVYKTSYMSIITNEIKTPLNGILGMTDLLLDTNLDEEQRSLTETIKSSGNSLLFVVNDILDYSKIDFENIVLEEMTFDLRATVENVVDLVSITAHDKELNVALLIHSDVAELIVGDPFRLRQVLLRLLSNAVTFTEKGEIVITITKIKMVSDKKVELRFEVTDTGIGIPIEKQKDLFSAYPLFDSPVSLDHHTTGQGLVVSKQLIELMNGVIGLESKPGQGSRFWFTAQFGIDEKPDEKRIRLAQTILGMRCLIVSDFAIGRKVLSLHINHWGGTCKEASSVDNVVEKIQTALESNQGFDAILIDLKEGDVDAYGRIASDINKSMLNKKLRPCKLICLTAKTQRGDAKKLQELGYSVYLTKPIKQSHLFKSLLMVKNLYEEDNNAEDTTIITKYYVDECISDFYQVLVIEANPENQKSIVTQLLKLKIRSDVAIDGKAAISNRSMEKYDLVLVSCDLPENDGFEAARLIREKEDGKDKIPIIALIRDSEKEVIEKCLSAGMDGFVTRPFEQATFLNTLRKHLHR